MVKDLDGAVYDTFKLIVDGEYEEDHLYTKGAGPSGVYLAIDDYTKDIVPQEIIDQVQEIQDKIVAGEIQIERYTEE